METVTADELLIKDLWVRDWAKKTRTVPTGAKEITDGCLSRWATEICANVFNKETDKSHSGEHPPVTKGDGKNN